MPKKLFLLDGMALVYRAHFALIRRPVFTSQGVNTSALFGFTQTLLDVLANRQPTHLAVAFDTPAPTARHQRYPAYKIQREAMPEDIQRALPNVRRLLDTLRIPVLTRDGYEADDIIGTLVRRAEPQGFESYMVSPDKDLAQLVTPRTLLYKPGRMGSDAEILGSAEVCRQWGIARPEQVIDILGLWGDASDNIPGVPGIGEKTAAKLIAQFGSVEALLALPPALPERWRNCLTAHAEQARLSKWLATIDCAVPLAVDLEELKLRPPDEAGLRRLLAEFEFGSIGRRLFGEDFRVSPAPAPRVAPAPAPPAVPALQEEAPPRPEPPHIPAAAGAPPTPAVPPGPAPAASVTREYRVVNTAAERSRLIQRLSGQASWAFACRLAGPDPRQAPLTGLAFSVAPQTGDFVPLPREPAARTAVLAEFRPVWENEASEKVGHDLKAELSALRGQGVTVRGPLFDTMLAHALVEPELRHTLPYLAEALLGAAPRASGSPPVDQGQLDLAGLPTAPEHDDVLARADLAGQLRPVLESRLHDKGQARVFHDVEAPLIPVLVDMEYEGVRVDAAALTEVAGQLGRNMAEQEKLIHQLAGREFNLNSPRQLGEILFGVLHLGDAPKKTRTGQYATDEQTLLALAADHEIVRHLLDYRACSKLKSTYADALPSAISPPTGRVHTTYQQLATATGRLNSQNPNLQNIPIRTERGQEIRRAFVPRGSDYLLLSADYSQIELRIIAALSREPAMLEAFHSGADIHTATAARVFGVAPDQVTPAMRKQAKMVNYGIAYGISAFGLAQRLGIPRKEAAMIIDQYFAQFPGIRRYMTDTVEFARQRGSVETVTGRRRYLRDIQSSNATVRSAAERNAINAPIQGTAADMIKIAMVHIHRDLSAAGRRTRLLLQVHDELVFDLHRSEQAEVLPLVEDRMRNALALDVPIVVELGTGQNWLEAH